MSEEQRRPFRYYEDAFAFTPSGRRVSELTDEELLIYDSSRLPKPEPPPPGPPGPRSDEQDST